MEALMGLQNFPTLKPRKKKLKKTCGGLSVPRKKHTRPKRAYNRTPCYKLFTKMQVACWETLSSVGSNITGKIPS